MNGPVHSSKSWGELGQEVGKGGHISGLSSKHLALAF